MHVLVCTLVPNKRALTLCCAVCIKCCGPLKITQCTACHSMVCCRLQRIVMAHTTNPYATSGGKRALQHAVARFRCKQLAKTVDEMHSWHSRWLTRAENCLAGGVDSRFTRQQVNCRLTSWSSGTGATDLATNETNAKQNTNNVDTACLSADANRQTDRQTGGQI